MSRNQLPPPSREELDIIRKCNILGAEVQRLDDFRRDRNKFIVDEAIAKLFAEELEKPHEKNFLAIIMQVGAVPQFRDILLPPIVKIARREGNNYSGGDAINALDKIVLPQDSNLIAGLLCDAGVGSSRALLIPIYARIAKKSAIPVLRKIIHDSDTRIYALKHLSILGDTTIEHELNELAKHPDGEIRKIARDALKRVEKSKLKEQNRTLN